MFSATFLLLGNIVTQVHLTQLLAWNNKDTSRRTKPGYFQEEITWIWESRERKRTVKVPETWVTLFCFTFTR